MASRSDIYRFLLFILFLVDGVAHAHGVGPSGVHLLEWRTDQISHVVGREKGALGSGASLVIVDGKRCVTGGWFGIGVRDSFAFDIDEDVDLEVEFFSPSGLERVGVTYDASDALPFSGLELFSEPADDRYMFSSFGKTRWQRKTLTLPGARFSNRGEHGSDFAIYSRNGSAVGSEVMTICDIRLKRSYGTSIPDRQGWIALEVTDELGRPVSARAGIYTKDGRSPLPSADGVLLRRFDEMVRTFSLRSGTGAWPAKSRVIFYLNGQYHARLPEGEYELVLSKGPEYRVVKRSFGISADETQKIAVKLLRWDDMPQKGWYSGDTHIHYARVNEADDRSMLALAEAEDLHVANLLQMGNRGSVYFRQYGWDKVWRGDDTFLLAPGQEDPRTTHRGHTVHLNLQRPVRDPLRYMDYASAFEQTRAQGAVVGYAHASDIYDFPFADGLGHRRGMALDVPLGLVDFIEVLQFGVASTRTWFDFLNLGFQLSPVAGTDYPYIDLPGMVRTYVHVYGKFTSQSWFSSLKKGHVFVTDGAMLELDANGQKMGSVLQLRKGEKLEIHARARLNPDFGRLTRLMLIEQGEVVKVVSSADGTDGLELDFEAALKHGTWFVLRAEQEGKEGGTAGVALSAPIYVYADGEGFWKPVAVPSIIAALRQDMKAILEPSNLDLEAWDSTALNRKHWTDDRALLQRRVDQANAIYDDLLKRAEQALAKEKEQTLAAQRTEETTPPMAK